MKCELLDVSRGLVPSVAISHFEVGVIALIVIDAAGSVLMRAGEGRTLLEMNPGSCFMQSLR